MPGKSKKKVYSNSNTKSLVRTVAVELLGVAVFFLGLTTIVYFY